MHVDVLQRPQKITDIAFVSPRLRGLCKSLEHRANDPKRTGHYEHFTCALRNVPIIDNMHNMWFCKFKRKKKYEKIDFSKQI